MSIAVLSFLTGLVAVVVGLGCCVYSAPAYHGTTSDHFDGERFVNQSGEERRGYWALIRWQLDRDQGPWRDVDGATPGPPPPRRVGGGRLRVTWVNHATVLVQTDGVNFLTDPMWSERGSPVPFAGPRRVRPPGLRFDDLPPIDVVLISHNHYDHLDLPTMRRLVRAHHPRILAGLGNRRLFVEEGISGAEDLDWWESVEIRSGVRVTSVPAEHFSGRGLCDRDRTLWTGFVIQASGGPVYFAGDTGMGSHFAQVRERFGPVRLAILPIGAYLPRWFMKAKHLSPDDAVEAHLILGARTSLGTHFGTIPLGDDGQEQPPRDLRRALGRRGVVRDRFWVLGFGEGRDVPEVAFAPRD